jgi:HSP20 family molecular chaperone IbpA
VTNLQKGFYSFKKYDDPFSTIDRMADKLLKTFVYDNPFSVVTINQEKEKHNFSTRHWQEIIKDDKAILAYDVHGFSESDLKVTKTSEDGMSYITIKGKTKNEILDCEMEIKTRWMIPYKQFKKPTKKIENGMLYIFVEPDKTEEEIEEI